MSDAYSLCGQCGAYWECGCTWKGRPVGRVIFNGESMDGGNPYRLPDGMRHLSGKAGAFTVRYPDFDSFDMQGNPERITDQSLTIYPDVEGEA